jgi:predicted thioesterase
MPQHPIPAAGRQHLLTQLENYKATRDLCRPPERAIYEVLVRKLEEELASLPLDENVTHPIPAPAGSDYDR